MWLNHQFTSSLVRANVVLKDLRKFLTMIGISQPLNKILVKLSLSYALNAVNILIVLISWFYYNLSVVRASNLTFNEDSMQYFMLGAASVIMS